MELPTGAVLLMYFHNIVNKFNLNLKELAVYQCANCLKIHAELCNAHATKKKPLVKSKDKELDLHRQHSDKGYVHHTMLTALCILQWSEMTLETAGEAGHIA